jgi:hypothetical protein
MLNSAYMHIIYYVSEDVKRKRYLPINLMNIDSIEPFRILRNISPFVAGHNYMLECIIMNVW